MAFALNSAPDEFTGPMHGQKRNTKIGRPGYGLPERFRHVIILIIQKNPFIFFDERKDQILYPRRQLQSQPNLEEIDDSFKIVNHPARRVYAGHIQGHDETLMGVDVWCWHR